MEKTKIKTKSKCITILINLCLTTTLQPRTGRANLIKPPLKHIPQLNKQVPSANKANPVIITENTTKATCTSLKMPGKKLNKLDKEEPKLPLTSPKHTLLGPVVKETSSLPHYNATHKEDSFLLEIKDKPQPL